MEYIFHIFQGVRNLIFFPGWSWLKKGVFFFHTSNWWHSLPSMQYINRWKLFLMCHCLSKMGIGSTDEMTSTWRCRLYHMAVSLAIKKNWQARGLLWFKQRSWFSAVEPDSAHFDSFRGAEIRWLGSSEVGGAWTSSSRAECSGAGLLLCRAAGVASTRTRVDARTHGQTRTHAYPGRCVLSQKNSSLVLILGHKSSGSLSGPNSGLKLRLLFTALLLVRVGNKEDKLFYTAFSEMGV